MELKLYYILGGFIYLIIIGVAMIYMHYHYGPVVPQKNSRVVTSYSVFEIEDEELPHRHVHPRHTENHIYLAKFVPVPTIIVG